MMSTATINAFYTKNRIVPSRSCNCRAKTECPMSENCRKESVVYPATVSHRVENSLKTRYSNHKSSFSKANKCHNTELGKYIWYLKENLTKFKVKWRILQHTASSNPTSNRCNLCLWEKYFIISKPDLPSLNKRNESISSWRHASKYALENFSPKVWFLFFFALFCFLIPSLVTPYILTFLNWWRIYWQR